MTYRWVVLIFGMLAYTTSYFARTNYTGIAKFVSADLGLDKASLGVMGSVFLYAYALSQMPWGFASDRWGSRKAIGLGVFLTAMTLWGFATSGSYNALLFWRATNGIAAAAVYVAMAGTLSRWFAPAERGFCQSIFAAVGATVGEGTANLILPYLAIHVASGWRQSTNILAEIIAGIGIACVLFLRSAPPGQHATIRKPLDWATVKDLQLWCFILVYAGSIISLRILPIWLPIYAADIYINQGMPLQQAVLAAGVLSTLYLAGRLTGVPLTGFISDRLVNRGISHRGSLPVDAHRYPLDDDSWRDRLLDGRLDQYVSAHHDGGLGNVWADKDLVGDGLSEYVYATGGRNCPAGERLSWNRVEQHSGKWVGGVSGNLVGRHGRLPADG